MITVFTNACRSCIFIFLIVLLPGRKTANCQSNSLEIIGSAGFTSFSGDVGGSSPQGKGNMVDFDVRTFRQVFGLGFRYHFTNQFSLRFNGYYGSLYGDDKFAADKKYRFRRNLNFRSDVWDFALLCEFSLLNWNVSSAKRRARLRWARTNETNLYLFAGISVFHFNPQGELNDKWYDLRDLSTEGQGLPGGPKQYSLVAVSIPVGIGYKHLVNEAKGFSIGFELIFRKSFTDHIDDVSGNYYDNNLLGQFKGNLAADIADKNIRTDGLKRPGGTRRGNNASNDNFTYFVITLNKTLNMGGRGRDLPCAFF